MKTFLRENWAWIAVPMLLVATFVVAVLVTTTDAIRPFDYSVF